MKRSLFLIVLIVVLSSCNIGKDKEEKEVDFNTDHGFHDNNWEWVYFSGVVETENDKEISIMFTIFQQGIDGNYQYPRILTVLDTKSKEFYEEWDLSSTESNIFSDNTGLELDNAKYKLKDNGNVEISGEFSSNGTVFGIDLELEPTLDPLLHGENGFIPMGDGEDSGYYSFTNMKPAGTVNIGNESLNVNGGRMWMDHQWGDWDSNTGMNWDWFSLRFKNGGSLMLFQFRNWNNNVLHGNWTYRNGSGETVYGEDYTVEASDEFIHEMETTIAKYPINWKIDIPKIDATFNIKPFIDDQAVSFIWEGLCTMEGSIDGNEVDGDAFVELSGYLRNK